MEGFFAPVGKVVRAELYCEAFAHSYGLETVRLRYFNVFGPRQDPNSPYSASNSHRGPVIRIAAHLASKSESASGSMNKSSTEM